jgi:hypothetical protein
LIKIDYDANTFDNGKYSFVVLHHGCVVASGGGFVFRKSAEQAAAAAQRGALNQRPPAPGPRSELTPATKALLNVWQNQRWPALAVAA